MGVFYLSPSRPVLAFRRPRSHFSNAWSTAIKRTKWLFPNLWMLLKSFFWRRQTMKHLMSALVVLTLLAIGLPGARAQIVEPLDATIAVSALAQVNPDHPQFDRTTANLQGGDIEMGLGLMDSADIMVTNSNGSAEAKTSINATWDNPGSGLVQFGDSGWITNVNDAGGMVGISGGPNRTRWTYRFRNHTPHMENNSLIINYSTSTSPDTTDPTGLDGFRVVVILGGYKPILDQIIAPGDSGTITLPLAMEEGFTFSIIARASLDHDPGSRIALMDGDFAWQVMTGK
jgi:hypothetical protein